MMETNFHGKWGIWLYSVSMWYHTHMNNQFYPQVFETKQSAETVAEKLWQEYKCKAQVRQYDVNDPDYPCVEVN